MRAAGLASVALLRLEASGKARSPIPTYRRLAAAISILIHAMIVAVLIATGGFEARRVPLPDHVIDIVNLQNFQTSPPPVAELSAPAAAPPAPETPPLPSDSPNPAPPATSSEAPSDPTVLHEELAPAEAGSTGMSVATGAPRAAAPQAGSSGGDEDYMPQFKITEVPVIPVKEVLSKIEYPALAAKQGIEATVYLELYIDKHGTIVRATVLKDPGFGFSDAAIKVLVGVVCSPAKMNGEPVAVRYRYPVRFKLK
jgi:TonB family protein